MTASVVVGLDGSGHSLRALMWAAHNASMRGAPLRLVHVITVAELSFPYSRYKAAEDRGREILEEARTLAGHAYPDVDITVEMPDASAAQVFWDVSAAPVFLKESDQAALIVLGGKGRALLHQRFTELPALRDAGHALLGSVALQVVGHAACPVVIVGHVPAGYRTIVVGTDGSPDAKAALAFAFEEAAMRGYRLQIIVCAGMQHLAPPGTVHSLPEEHLAELHRDLKQQVEPLRARDLGVDVEEHVIGKSPVDALADASLRADLLVVGSRGKGGFHGLAMGSVSHKLLHLAACPVAVVRAPQK